jgi:ferredoxin--NADP+ reductase
MTIAARPLPPRVLPSRRTESLASARPAPNSTLIARHGVGSSSALFVFDLDAAITGYRAGQYMALGVTGGQGIVQRPYSVVSVGNTGRRVELLVRRVERGALSPRLWLLPAGSRVHMGPPRGLFTLADDGEHDRWLVGAGTGVAPLLAMLREAAARSENKRATLIHAVSYADELVFSARIDRWRRAGLDLEYVPTVSRPDEPRNAGWAGEKGRAEAQLARMVGRPGFDPGRTVAYICGNPPMVDACSALLRNAGMTDGAIRAERF